METPKNFLRRAPDPSFPLKHRTGPKPQWTISADPMEYQEALKIMKQRVHALKKGVGSEWVWLLEHPSVYTAGRNTPREEIPETPLIPFYESDRGGKLTYHGPGQRIAYVIMDLNKRGKDLRAYVWSLEEWLIQSLASWGVQAQRREGRVGLWVTDKDSEKKIASVGVRIEKWITFHGISLNINPDLRYFETIVPCGLKRYGVTSLEALGVSCSMQAMDATLQQTFQNVF